RALSLAGQVLRRAAAEIDGAASSDDEVTGTLEKELQQQQIETGTAPHSDLDALAEDVQAWRQTAIDAARDSGARVAALGTCPIPVEPRPVKNDRFRKMSERFGITTEENLTCGCHVHVSVDSREE